MCPLGPLAPQSNLSEAISRAFDVIERDGADAVASGCGGLRGADAGEFALEVLGRAVVIDVRRREVRVASGARVEDRVAAPVARYAAYGGRLRAGRGLVAFADVADARGYVGPFRARVVEPLVASIGGDPAALARAALAPGCRRAVEVERAGSSAFAVRVVPKVEIVFVLDPGDDELEPSGQALFDPGLFEAFAVDDVVAFAELASRALRGGRVLP
jgi:hypothetical protein